MLFSMAVPAQAAPRSIQPRASRSAGEARTRGRPAMVSRKASREKISDKGVRALVTSGLQRVSQGVNAAASRDPRRLGKGQRGVKEGDARGGFGVAAGHLLMGLLVGDEGKGLAFAARAAGGGDGEQRQHGARGLANAPVILHLAAIGEDEVAALGGVHAAAAAQADDGVNGGAAGDFDASFHAPRVVGFSWTCSKQVTCMPAASSKARTRPA